MTSNADTGIVSVPSIHSVEQTATRPDFAIDLTFEIQTWEVSYNSPAYLQARHNLPHQLIQNIAVVEALAAKAAE